MVWWVKEGIICHTLVFLYDLQCQAWIFKDFFQFMYPYALNLCICMHLAIALLNWQTWRGIVIMQLKTSIQMEHSSNSALIQFSICYSMQFHCSCYLFLCSTVLCCVYVCVFWQLCSGLNCDLYSCPPCELCSVWVKE